MSVRYFVLLFTSIPMAVAQTENARIVPKVITLFLAPNATATVHLGSGYVTSVRLPDDVNSIVLGDPSRFRAEHAEAEPRLVFLKSVSEEAARSNALITTKSGETVELDLIGMGKVVGSAHLDLLVECRRGRDPLVVSASPLSPVSETRSLGIAGDAARSLPSPETDLIGEELEKQRATLFPLRGRGHLLAVVGDCKRDQQRTLVGFTVVNRSSAAIELLPPQVELAGATGGRKRKALKAEPVLVSEYRMSARRISPGERVDGVVEFERPAFKESGEALQLRLAQADQVDRPLIVPIPFIASQQGELP